MQPLAAPPTGFFLHDNTLGERERGRGRGGCQLALRAGDNFLISSPPILTSSQLHFSLPPHLVLLRAKCPFGGTPGLPLMCPEKGNIFDKVFIV